MKKLIEQLGSIYPLSVPLKAYLINTVEVREIKRRERLVRPGQVCEHMYYIEKGLFRGSYLQHGKEQCLWFMKEGNMMTSIVSYDKEKPSLESIYAMENGRIYSVTKQQLEHIYHNYLEFNFIGRTMTQQYYVLAAEREQLLRIKTAAEKYERFLRLYPDLEERILAKYIASYLGISMETLSRIKNK
jgi:CRP-like cAMP-binding protein